MTDETTFSVRMGDYRSVGLSLGISRSSLRPLGPTLENRCQWSIDAVPQLRNIHQEELKRAKEKTTLWTVQIN